MAKKQHKAQGEARPVRKLTVKQEKFCVELARTGNQYEAYSAAYKTDNMKRGTIDNEASRLMQNPQITIRVQELQGEAAQEAVLTRAWVLRELMDNVTKAKGTNDYTASNKALELLGKTDELQMFVERKHVESDNRHHHSKERLSSLAEHLEEVLGSRPEDQAEGSIPN